MPLNTIFFDLDSTLYPESNGMWAAIRKRIDQYLLERMKFSRHEIPKIRQDFFINHGTTLRGLQIHYDVDPEDYLNFVHDLPLHQYLKPEPQLREMLMSIPSRRWIFTNSDEAHVNRVTDAMGITDCFEGIVDIWKMLPMCKPMEGVYRFALELAGVANPKDCAFLDDSHRNLEPAHKMGFFTVLVGNNGNHAGTYRSVANLLDLPKAVPEFWAETNV